MKPADRAFELEPFTEHAPAELLSALQGLQARLPDAEQLASLGARLSLQGLPVAPPPPSALPAARTLSKLWLGAPALLLGGGALVLAYGSSGRPAPTTPQPAETRLQAAQPSPSGHAPPAEAAAPGGAPRGVAPTSAAAPARGPSEVAAPGQPPADTAAPAPVPSSTPAAVAEATSEATAATPGPRASRKHVAVAPEPQEPAPAPGAAAVPSELDLLGRARLALRRSPGEALQLTEQHARLYPGGAMTQERELIAMTALVVLGRRTAALSRAASFDKAYPSSPYRRQVEQLFK